MNGDYTYVFVFTLFVRERRAIFKVQGILRIL